VDPARRELQEEQHVDPFEEHRFLGEHKVGQRTRSQFGIAFHCGPVIRVAWNVTRALAGPPSTQGPTCDRRQTQAE
jgi:hypothetical protein